MYSVASDIGGTFTDFVYLNKKTGEFKIEKTLTTKNFADGVINGITQSKIDASEVASFVHGSTIIINTLCERKGAKVGLITTKGFRDVLEITRSNRPDLYNLLYKMPPCFIPRHLRVEVNERVDYHGSVVTSLDPKSVETAVKYLVSQDVKAIAVCFLHSYANPSHELECGRMISKLAPKIPVTLSHGICCEWREYERTSTCALNSYCLPVSVDYITKLTTELQKLKIQEDKCHIMQSNGGTFTMEQAKSRPIQCCESGPVSGVIGASIIGKLIGEENLITLDFGGTTTKCSLIKDGVPHITTEYFLGHDPKVAKYPIKVPTIDIVEIGSGGGSYAHFDEAGNIKVGPDSMGAFPGPACYGFGGSRVTVTDANLYNGRLNDSYFCGGDVKVYSEKSKEVLEKLRGEYKRKITTPELANGIISLADANMVSAIKLVSVRKGYDPKDFTVVAFGGNGPVHASALTSYLNVKKIIIPLNPGVFSAYGMLLTDARRDVIRTKVVKLADETIGEVERIFVEMERDISAQIVLEEKVESKKIVHQRFADMRYYGQEHTVKVEISGKIEVSNILTKFHDVHEKTFTFKMEKNTAEIVNFHVIGLVPKEFQSKKMSMDGKDFLKALKGERDVYFNEFGSLSSKIYERDLLPPDNKYFLGPCVIEEKTATTVVFPHQKAKIDEFGFIHIENNSEFKQLSIARKINPFLVDIIQDNLVAISEEMFLSTKRTSMSTIIYEVLDFAVGITDKIGRLVSQGNGVAMFISLLSFNVKEVVRKFKDNLHDGDLVILNCPYVGGGTHLSDVSVIKPVFYDGKLVMFCANKAHWTEVGGKNAGSWSTDANEVYQEGLRFTGLKIYSKGVVNEALVELIKANVRTPDQTIGDLKSQMGSLNLASKRINTLCDRYGVDNVLKAVDKIIDDSAEISAKSLKKLPKKKVFVKDIIDDDGLQAKDIPICCSVDIQEEKCVVDFTGSSAAVPGPINCGKNATETGCRCVWSGISNSDVICSNDGIFQNLEVIIPEKSILGAQLPSSVSTYWETMIFCGDVMWQALSQVVPDKVTAGHFTSVCAVSAFGFHQDTKELFVLVEPLPGGWGAGTKKDGESGLVCVGDGETYIIPVEVCEKKYGVRVNRYEFDVLDDSSGAGEFRGGRGIIREYEVVSDSLFLTTTFGRHKYRPWGMLGGEKGSTNFVEIVYKDDRKPKETFGKCASKPLVKGDKIILHTGTGGGCGNRLKRSPERVRNDLLNEFITARSAKEDYGVVIDEKTFKIVGETEERKKVK